MARTLLQIATAVSRRLPLSQDPTTVVGNSDPQVRQLLELLQEEGDELTERHQWSQMYGYWQFVVTNALTQPGVPGSVYNFASFPSDYNRLDLDASLFRSDTQLTPMSGPVPNDSWWRLLTIPGTFPGYWRLVDGGMETIGAATGVTCTIPYVSNSWILNTNGVTTYNLWQSDTDTPRINDNLFVLGGRWRWKQSKGLDYAEDMATYEKWLERAIAGDRAARPIATAKEIMQTDLSKYTWPGTIIVP